MEPITFEEVSVLDANSEYRGVRTKTLMENAGRGAAEHILHSGGAGKRVLVFCGTGNNGGDGFVAARHLSEECQVEIVLMRTQDRVRSEMARANLRHAKEVGVPVRLASDGYKKRLRAADIIVDAMLGVGVTGAPRGEYAEAVEAINASGKRVVSVDIPTGWGTELAVRPGSTVTFHAPKIGMGEECGEVVVKDIGVPAEAISHSGPGELLLIPRVARDAHKGKRGTVLVVGGGPYTGAPLLAALAAHRMATDLVYVAVPGAIAEVARAASLDLIVHPVGDAGTEVLLPEHADQVMRHATRADALVLGPGLGDDLRTLRFVKRVYMAIAEAGKPVVVDADALKALGGEEDLPWNPRVVLTPHAGEFATLSGAELPAEPKARERAVRELAGKMDCVVIAKGVVDVVSDGPRSKLNDNGNPAMATGGTGDVLAGIAGALLAKGMDAFDAARTAVFVAGAAGDEALERLGHSMLGSDMLDSIPEVMSKNLPWWSQR